MNQPRLHRRDFLRGALITGLVVPIAGTLASCAATGSSQSGGGSSASASTSANNPFGIASGSTVAAAIFNGGYGTDYVDYAANVMKQKVGVGANVDAITNIAQSLQPKFVAGNPPDLVDNSGANAIGISTIRGQLAELSDVLEANNYEGTKISDTLYTGVTKPGTLDGKFLVLNYVLTVYALWYSQSLFDENGWTVPKTWDEAYDLGGKAKAKGKYLFVWGKEAATYYQTLAIASAIKEGGDDVRLALENLEKDCWSKPAVQAVFTAMKKIIDAGYFKPGGAGTQFTAAQAQWSSDEDALLYPSGSWIENEMKKQTKSGFKMTGAPEPVVSSNPAMPYEAMHSTAGEPFIVPSKAGNVAGGKELLRAMLSKDAATNFTKTRLTPTIVKGIVPADGFGSTALVSQSKLLEDAGSNVFSWNFVDLYGMNQDQLVVWNTFLSGGSSVAQLTKGLQDITDKVANDSSVTKVKVS
ncbi:N-acetylglucosamine/diacetylchitobiose ABC transporter substrate-binding protein [Amnibacterium endophyticum]|uniref:N-acetylglucosamine/diacetylchitobiose ABC transporter substrate-binding protein n=1 Tax=Amnibacterium endophyticum TaxID=2109337 RepID=A0ABW4LFE4_9MICO